MTPVETRLLLPYLAEHLAPHTGPERYPAVSELAKASGIVGVRELKKILAGMVEAVDVETADALLVAIGRPELWQTDDALADIYNAAPEPTEAELANALASSPLTPNGNGRLLTAAELGDYLGLSPATMLDWAGKVPHFKIGHAVRFREAEVSAWLERDCRRGPAAPCLRPERV